MTGRRKQENQGRVRLPIKSLHQIWQLFFKAVRTVFTERQGGSHICCKAGVHLRFPKCDLWTSITWEKLGMRPSVRGLSSPVVVSQECTSCQSLPWVICFALEETENSTAGISGLSYLEATVLFTLSHLLMSVHSCEMSARLIFMYQRRQVTWQVLWSQSHRLLRMLGHSVSAPQELHLEMFV